MVFRRLLSLTIILTLLASPAFAALTLGMVPAPKSPLRTRQQATRFADYLGSQLNQPVELRVFQDEQSLHRWLSRYREVDIALLGRSYYEQTQTGSYLHLADYIPSSASPARTVDTLVARRGLAPEILQGLKDILMVMDTEPTGSRLLSGLIVEQFASPRTSVVPPSKPAPPARPAQSTPDRHLQAATTGAKAAEVPAAEKTPPPAPPAATKPAPDPQPAARPDRPQAAPADSAESAVPAEDAAQPGAQAETVEPRPVPETAAAKSGSEIQPPAAKDQAAPAVRPVAADGDSLSLWPIVVLVLLSGLVVKAGLLLRQRPRKRPSLASPTTLIQHEWAELHPEGEARKTPPAATSPARAVAPELSDVKPSDSIQDKLKPLPIMKHQPLDPAGSEQEPPPTAAEGDVDLNLGGTLTPAQVPSMLQFIAASGREGKLRVRSEFDEKIISFKNGEIVAAASVNLSNKNQSGFLMNKLGYLLIRQGKISEDDRDQALVMCENDPNLRLGEALIKLGLLTDRELKISLRDQAKMILHSMIVFPEGEFKFIPERLNLTHRDNLGINVKDFLQEAASHQNEWRNIRQLIPSLDTVLQFAEGGRDKVNSGRMTVHQKYVLSLINGRRPIREICQEATMLDYELYRFLYLMTKARILERRPTASRD